jgi:ribonuclease-3
MSDVLVQLQSRLGYTFRQPALLKTAFTHLSFLPENPGVTESNQRLEFLGDAVLQLLLTEALYQLFPDDREGPLSRRRAALAKGMFLVKLARELGLDGCLQLGTSEELTGGRQKPSALEDAFEALVGALYLDSDLEQTRRIVMALYGNLAERLDAIGSGENPKGQLQELVQPKFGNHALRYDITSVEGEDHARAFEVQVLFNDRAVGRGRGTSKKLAEEAAARAALDTLKAELEA